MSYNTLTYANVTRTASRPLPVSKYDLRHTTRIQRVGARQPENGEPFSLGLPLSGEELVFPNMFTDLKNAIEEIEFGAGDDGAPEASKRTQTRMRRRKDARTRKARRREERATSVPQPMGLDDYEEEGEVEDDEEEGYNVFVVAAIHNSRWNRQRRRFEYQLEWEESGERTWEPLENVDSCQERVDNFHQRFPNKPRPEEYLVG